MFKLRSIAIASCAFAAGLLFAGQIPRVAAQKGTAQVNDISDKTIARVRASITDTKWDLGKGDWQQFLSGMKTTNRLNRTGNWVVTDEKTVMTGGRGSQGAVYIWKFDPKHRKATISKYVRDAKYKRSARRIK